MIRNKTKTILSLLVMILMFSSLSGCNQIPGALPDVESGKAKASSEAGTSDKNKDNSFKKKKKKDKQKKKGRSRG